MEEQEKDADNGDRRRKRRADEISATAAFKPLLDDANSVLSKGIASAP